MARGGVFFIEFTNPHYLSVAQVRGRLLRALQLQGEAMKRDFLLTTATWKNHHPVFFVQVNYGGGNSRVHVYTMDKTWMWLNSGTRVRYATMSRNFIAKTTPGVLGSGPGKGYMKYVSTRFPRPGIHARNWTILVRIKHTSPFAAAVYNATVRSLALTTKP